MPDSIGIVISILIFFSDSSMAIPGAGLSLQSGVADPFHPV
jgi:hypothetical protein